MAAYLPPNPLDFYTPGRVSNALALHCIHASYSATSLPGQQGTVQYSIRAGVYHPHDNTYKVLYHTIEIGDCRRLMHSMGLRIFCGQ